MTGVRPTNYVVAFRTRVELIGLRAKPVLSFLLPAIDLGTLADRLAHRHRCDAYCFCCNYSAALDLSKLVTAGQGDRSLPIPVQCQGCGSRPPEGSHVGADARAERINRWSRVYSAGRKS